MPVKKEDIQNYNALSPILDELSEWYSDLLCHLFYPEDICRDLAECASPSFELWLKNAADSPYIEPEILQKLENLNRDLHILSGAMFREARDSKQKPLAKCYDQLSTIYFAIRRVELDAVLEDSGIDALTGLRSKHAMKIDIEREIERLARRGKPFSLALARIDLYDQLVEEHGRERAREYTKIIAHLIKKSMRSFDDGYRLGNGEFILCLKQADVSGGVAALERLKKMLEEREIKFSLYGKDRHLTMSCCIAAPFPGDQVDELVDNLRKDLATSEKPANMLLEYHEMSELQRFVQETS
jgi:diguanylate cyclase